MSNPSSYVNRRRCIAPHTDGIDRSYHYKSTGVEKSQQAAQPSNWLRTTCSSHQDNGHIKTLSIATLNLSHWGLS